MSTEESAIHSIRNSLTPILCFAQMASAGDREAQRLVIKELVDRQSSIHDGLDVLARAVRRQRSKGTKAS